MISQDLSQFALHVRAILGLPIPNIVQHGPAASSVILGEGHSEQIGYAQLEIALQAPDTQLRLFGNLRWQDAVGPGSPLARAETIEAAVAKAKQASAAVGVKL